MSSKNIELSRSKGFTIVELLVVIVVIGILAAITIVSYTGITARAKTSAGQSATAEVLAKANVYLTDGPTGTWPTSYGALTGAATTTSYYMSGVDFTPISGDKVMSATTRGYAGLTFYDDSVDFTLCGANGTVSAPTTYSGITVPSGIKLGYWDFQNTSLNANLTAGTVSGNFPTTTSFPVACFKVGVGEAAAAVAKAIAADTVGGYYPYQTTQATFAAGGTNAKLPAGAIVTHNVTPTQANGTTNVVWSCLTACNATMTGGRIQYWDYATGAVSTAATSIYVGTATSGGTFVAAS